MRSLAPRFLCRLSLAVWVEGFTFTIQWLSNLGLVAVSLLLWREDPARRP